MSFALLRGFRLSPFQEAKGDGRRKNASSKMDYAKALPREINWREKARCLGQLS